MKLSDALKPIRCTTCKGKGKLKQPSRDYRGWSLVACPRCRTAGWVDLASKDDRANNTGDL